MLENNTLQRAVELCLAVYRITDKFPREEVLAPKIRAKCIDIIDNLVYTKDTPTNASRIFICENLEENIRALFAYFAVAEKGGWVDARNFHVLREAYRDLYQIAKLSEVKPRRISNGSISAGIERQTKAKSHQWQRDSRQVSLTERQEKILVFLNGKEGGRTISDISEKIQASNKTVERELKKLKALKLIRKLGNTRGARFSTL